MVNLLFLLLCLSNPCYSWTNALKEDPRLPHYLDVQISSHTSRIAFTAAITELATLQQELESLNNSVVFYPGKISILIQTKSLSNNHIHHLGSPEFALRDNNHIAIFNNSRHKINLMLVQISQTVHNILQAPLLSSSSDWVELKANYHCSASIHPHFEKFSVISTFVRLHDSNWRSPQNPRSPHAAWSNKDQTAFDALITTKSAAGESFNATEIKINAMKRNYESIIARVYNQREDSFVILGQLIDMLDDLQSSLSNFLLLIGVCRGNANFGTQLAQTSCPGLLLPSQFQHYEVEDLTCLANPEKIVTSYRIHQQFQIFSNGVFQQAVIVTSTISLVIQLVVYTYMLIRVIRSHRQAKSAANRAAIRKATRKSESRPLVSTGQVALNSIYVPPRANRVQ